MRTRFALAAALASLAFLPGARADEPRVSLERSALVRSRIVHEVRAELVLRNRAAAPRPVKVRLVACLEDGSEKEGAWQDVGELPAGRWSSVQPGVTECPRFERWRVEVQEGGETYLYVADTPTATPRRVEAIQSGVRRLKLPAGQLAGDRLELGDCKFWALPDGALRLQGVVRNGSRDRVSELTLIVRLEGVSRTIRHPIAGDLVPGEQRRIELEAPKAAALSGYTWSLDCKREPYDKERHRAPKQEAPPKAKPQPKPAEATPTGRALLGVRCGWLEADRLLERKPFLVRLVPRGETPPEELLRGKLRVVVTSEGKRLGVINRTLKKRDLGRSAGEIPWERVKPGTAAWDAERRELVIAILRAEYPEELELRLELRFKGKAGTFEFQELGPPYRNDPVPPR